MSAARPKRSMLLLETLVGLALLGMLGVWLIRIQAEALRQWSHAARLHSATQQMEALLAGWSDAGTPVTIPSQGELPGGLAWERACEPLALGEMGSATQVSVTISAAQHLPRDLLTVHWLVSAENR